MRKCTGNKYREETLYDNIAVLEMRVLFLDKANDHSNTAIKWNKRKLRNEVTGK